MGTYRTGSHLVVNLDIAGITEHHGIYIGNGEVIHLSRQGGGVLRTSLSSFRDGESVRVKRQAPDPSEAVERAKSYVGQDGYCVVSNNCEHFVNKCLNGRKSSNQISNAAHGIAHVGARAGVLGGNIAKVAGGALGVVTIASTGAKYVGEYIGLPDSVNTVIGSAGDMVAKPLESAIVGTFDTLGNTFGKLGDGEVLDAGVELIGGTISTAIDVVETPFVVVGDVCGAVWSWFD